MFNETDWSPEWYYNLAILPAVSGFLHFIIHPARKRDSGYYRYRFFCCSNLCSKPELLKGQFHNIRRTNHKNGNNNNNNSLFRTLNKFTLTWNLSKRVHNKTIEELKKSMGSLRFKQCVKLCWYLKNYEKLKFYLKLS